jgi:radical SAM superfamily enzyme YgiQ (UPF0313 family)
MKNTRIMLFSPELRERTYPGRPPIYYLAPALRHAGFKVMAVDVDIVGRKDFLHRVRDFSPHIIGGTSLSIQINEAMELLALVKAELPSAITVLGGNHATAAGSYLYPIHADYLDAVVTGEGLTTIVRIAEAVEIGMWDSMRSSIPGLILWDGFSVYQTRGNSAEDPNTFWPDLPYDPSYNFSIFDRIDGMSRKTFQFMTAFGCMNACFFCFSATNLRGEEKRVERRMSLSIVEAILRQAVSLGYEAVYFDDDTFTRDREHALAVTRLCKKLGLVFGCHTRPDCEDEELIRAFAENGCRYMFSGFETIVPEILRGANKTRDPEGYRNAYLRSYRLKDKVGIPVSAFMIHGMPRQISGSDYRIDTIEDSETSIKFAVEELDPTYLSMNVLRFLPNVPYSFAPQFGFLRPVEGPLHGGYFDQTWLRVNGKKDPRCFHPVLRAFEGTGSPTPPHMTPRRCYAILKVAVETVNRKNRRPNFKNQTRIVVDPWFEERFLVAHWQANVLQYELASFDQIDSA